MLLEMRGLSKRYVWGRSKPAIDGVDLSVNRGEVVGLVGLNGAGKTTTIRIAAGVTLADRGIVLADGHDNRKEKARASKSIGWVPEVPVHEPGGRVNRLMSYYGGFIGGVPNEQIAALLGYWGLAGYATRRFSTLSLGLKKRFALAVAELQDPPCFLLDEVFSGIDPEGGSVIRDWVLQRRRAGCGFLISSHQLRELHDLSDRIAIIHEGKVLEVVNRDAIPSDGRGRIRIEVDRVDETLTAILSRFGDVETRGKFVFLAGESADPGAVSSAIVAAGYVIRRFETEDRDLERYFLGLIRRNH